MVNYFRAYWNLWTMRKRAFWPIERLNEYRKRMLRSVLKHAYENVPYYHEIFDKLKIKPDDIKTVEDLRKLPILTKDDINRNFDKIVSRSFNIKKLKTVSTSGSTGKPLRIFISAAEDDYRKVKHLRANIALGQKPRDRWVIISAPIHFREIPRLQRLLGIYAPSFISVFDDVDKQFTAIERLKPDIIDGYASFLLLLAKEVEKRGGHSIKPRFMISGAEIIDVESRRFIEEAFQAPLFDQYAAMEFERIAWQCKEKNGYHIDFDSIILELVGKDGEAVSPGEMGKVVCTSLFNYAMPLIRYAVGDIAVAESSDVVCECGRTFPLLKSIEGRSESLIVLPNGRILSWSTFGWAMEFFKFYFEIDQYRVVQKKINSIDFLLKIRDDCAVDKEIMANELIKHIRETLNVDPEVALNVKFVDAMPPDRSGKLRKVISEINNNLL